MIYATVYTISSTQVFNSASSEAPCQRETTAASQVIPSLIG